MAAMNDRGQMLLIGAIVMAVSFVALGIVLNGSFHTETMAGEASDDVVSGESEYVERSITSDVESLVREVVENHPSSPSDQSLRMSTYLGELPDFYGSYYSRNDVLVDISPGGTPINMGTHVEHSGGPFSSSPVQRVVVNGQVRDFTLDSISLTGAGPFTIRVEDDAGHTWEVRIEDTATGPQVRVRGGPESIDETCSSRARTIDISEAIVGTGNQHCTALAHLSDVEPPYDIWFEGPDRIEGNYEMVVSDGAVDPANPAPTSPRLYGVETTIRIDTIGQSTERTVLIAPGEVHD